MGVPYKKASRRRIQHKTTPWCTLPGAQSIEKKGLIASSNQLVGRRVRKVYTITENGKTYLQTYYNIVKAEIISHKTKNA